MFPAVKLESPALVPALWQGRCALAWHAGPHEVSCRLVLVSPTGQRILAHCAERATGTAISLPRLSIPRWSRTAAEIQVSIEARWGLRAVVMDCFLDSQGLELTAISELIETSNVEPNIQGMEWLPLADIPAEATRSPNDTIRPLLATLTARGIPNDSPFLRLGWIKELLDWVSSVTPRNRFARVNRIEQLNATAQCALLKIQYSNGLAYWFKAVAIPDDREFDLTLRLSELFPEFLPAIVGSRRDWQGWIMRDAGFTLDGAFFPNRSVAEIGARLAKLQQASSSHAGHLLTYGLYDHRFPALRDTILELLPYLQEAVRSSRTDKAAYTLRGGLGGLLPVFESACERLRKLNLPDALVHGDLNVGNVLMANGSCIFTDWAEAAIGNPLLAIDQLRMHFEQNPRARISLPGISALYCRQWGVDLSETRTSDAFHTVRLLTLTAHLSNRKQWILSHYEQNPGLQSYLRSIATQMVAAIQHDKIPHKLTA